MTIDALPDAWDALHAALPPRWFVGRPSFDEYRGQWAIYAYDPFEKAVLGHREREWVAVGKGELEAVVEMTRCLGELREGKVPR